MNDKHITKLEHQLERLVENAFASLFRKSVSAHDLAMKLARSMANSLYFPQDNDPRPLAPDQYVIHLNPQVFAQFERSAPHLPEILSQQLIELATQSDYRLQKIPQIRLVADVKVDIEDLEVMADHSHEVAPTAMMKPVEMINLPPPPNPQLLLGEKTIPLTQGVVNIGRSDENTIVLDDPHVSRLHIQLRLRFGMYTLFDADSKTGTFVNNVQVREHRLQSGDVIRIGNTQLIYVVDEPKGPVVPGTTDIINPVQF